MYWMASHRPVELAAFIRTWPDPFLSVPFVPFVPFVDLAAIAT
jgi:hypothetical protein